uniref:Uncharacterized protein n=1 Tax=Strongyloides venezuelensis TaxID=75913 RepID=A0A0K0F0A7_STRVS
MSLYLSKQRKIKNDLQSDVQNYLHTFTGKVMESNQKLFEEHLNENHPLEEDIEPYPCTSENNQAQFFSLPELSMLERIIEGDVFTLSENRQRRFSDTDYLLYNQVYSDEDTFVDVYEDRFEESYIPYVDVLSFPERKVECDGCIIIAATTITTTTITNDDIVSNGDIVEKLFWWP